jgi:choline-sulfatase
LFILSDQHNRQMLSAAGDPVIQTPHLDALADRGTRFANAYCNSPICVPARAVLATGRYVHATRNWDNASPYTGRESPSWGHELAERGHQVTTIGKLHYRQAGDPTGFVDQRIPLHIIDGVGDLYPLLRGDAPPTEVSRRPVLNAGAGDSEYLRYDTAIADAAVEWLAREAPSHDAPWVLSVNFVNPHFPLIAPEEYLALYPPDEVPMPPQSLPEEWPHHPAVDDMRALMNMTEPFDLDVFQRARAAYYALVTFLDAQIGRVLDALRRAGLDDSTRVVYTSDHGEMLGARGLWWKHSMYEESVGAPLIIAPTTSESASAAVAGHNVSHVDLYPTIVEAVTGERPRQAEELPGRSLWDTSGDGWDDRVVFSEYHAMYSRNASFMVRGGPWKYVHHVGFPPQLFDLADDPQERRDVGQDDAHARVRRDLDARLREIVDPDEADRECKADAVVKLAAAGGADAVRAAGMRVLFSPTPVAFQ